MFPQPYPYNYLVFRHIHIFIIESRPNIIIQYLILIISHIQINDVGEDNKKRITINKPTINIDPILVIFRISNIII